MNFKRLLLQSIFWRGLYFFSLLLVNIFLSRYLQAAGTGNLYFITIIFSFMQVVLSLSFDAGIIYFASGQIIERNKLTGIIVSWSLISGIVMIALVYLFFVFESPYPDSLLKPCCIYAFCYVAGMSLMNYTTALFYTQDNFVLPNFLISLVNFLFIFFIPGKEKAPSAAEAEKIIYYFFAVFLVQGIVVFLSYLFKNRNTSSFGFPTRVETGAFFRYSITALAANVIFFLVYRIDYLFVNASPVCTAADLGNYIQVSKLGQMMLVVPQIVASVVFPRTASGVAREEMNKSIQIIARLFSQLYLTIFLFVAFFGKSFFILVFGESFNKMQAPMLLLIPGIFSISVLALLSAYFSGKGNVQVNVRGAILALIVMITGDFIFVPFYGIAAAAAISTISYTVNLAYSMMQFYKDYSISWIEFLRWKKADYNWLFSMLTKDKT
ncbi:MAG: polysaccharide biosynthesis C-terminal domain-containing protein [Parafilimonas sp.]